MGGATARSGEVRVEACASRAPRCAITDSSGVGSVWDFGSSPTRLLYDGVDCAATRFSPDGTRLMCRESENGVVLFSEGEGGDWTRTDVVLPDVTGAFLQDDGTISGTLPRRDSTASDRSDVLFFTPHECWTPPAVERMGRSIRMQPTGTGAVFSYGPTGRSTSGYTEVFGFDSKGESLAAASNAWFGERTDERLLEYDATNSAGEKSYDLAGLPFDPGAALADSSQVAGVQIDQAFFVESPEPSLIIEIGYSRRRPSETDQPLRAVARWDLRAKRFCGPALAGAITGVAPTGDAVVIDGRIDRIGACTPDRGFETTDVTHVAAVGPGAARWVSRDGESLRLQGPGREPTALPRAERGGEAQVAFSTNGAQFLVKTATSVCNWVARDDGTVDLDGCRWSTGGWASDAAWTADDETGATAVVLDRTAEGAALRRFFGSREIGVPTDSGGDLACNALPRPDDAPLDVLRRWEERLGHRFKDQATQLQDAREMTSSEIVSTDPTPR